MLTCHAARPGSIREITKKYHNESNALECSVMNYWRVCVWSVCVLGGGGGGELGRGA